MVIFQRVHEVYDFLLGVAGSEIQSPVTFFYTLNFVFR